MGYTRNLLPIPSTDVLLTESDFKNREVAYYKTPEAIKRALRVFIFSLSILCSNKV